ncbi:MAG TPA: DNA primase [Alphaproteobacteria bacterium]|nr:DNA primase [Alphaproteobacteria bacterium]
MALSPQFLDELRGRLGLVEVISRRVKLQRKGREHAGLCPFHSEKTPSFWVNEEKGFFHCFGCGAHGDVIGFVMRSESLSFPEAVERLAAEAGLAVPQSSPQERARAEKAKTLATALESACAFYETQLQGGAGREALDYLRRRGLDDVTIARFRLGFASQGNALKAHLLREGYDEALLLEAGLLGRNAERQETYDYFRGRVIFPIADGRGRIVAFGGRVLGEGTPKYLNSREGELFHKGRMLYGLAHARRGAAEEGRLVVVEGYMDVIALHQAGFGIAVAPLGTALTEAQLGELWRLVDEPILCFDGDAAGQRAAARAAERALPLLKPGKSLRFVTLPAGEDPDTLIQRQGVAAMREILEGARPLIDLVWELEVAAHPADTPERRARFEERIAAVAKRIQDPKIRDSYAWDLRQRYWQRFRRGAKAKGRAAAPPGPPAGLLGPRDVEILELRCYQGLLAALINHPALLDGLEEAVASLVPPLVPANRDLDNLRQAILKTWAAQPDIDSGALENHLKGLGFRGVLDRILVKEVYVAAPFAHPARAIEAAAEEWRHSYALLLQRGARLDQDEAERELAEDVTEESLTRFDARRRQRASDLERARIIDREETPDSKLG